jgi:hypothetical protein
MEHQVRLEGGERHELPPNQVACEFHSAHEFRVVRLQIFSETDALKLRLTVIQAKASRGDVLCKPAAMREKDDVGGPAVWAVGSDAPSQFQGPGGLSRVLQCDRDDDAHLLCCRSHGVFLHVASGEGVHTER